MMKPLFTALLLFLFFSSNAQNVLTGRVFDAATSTPLSDATVGIENTPIGTLTDARGQFRLEGIEGEKVAIVVAFLGYEQQRIVFQMKNNHANTLEVRLKPTDIQLGEVTVRGIAAGQIAAFIKMQQAENIKNIVSAEQILTFPDMNAAEVMQRIPGITLQRDQGEGRFVQLRGTPPELTNFNINGEQVPSPEGNYRYVGMDIIPADQIGAVEVTKVMTPDMDADGIGGSVNIQTKAAEDGPPQLRATFAGGYNHLRQTPNYNLQLSYGQRYNRLGFQINGSFFENNQGSDNIEYNFIKGPFFNSSNQGNGIDNYQVHYREAQLRHYDITRTRISLSPTFDFRLNDRHEFYLRAMYNRFTDREIRRRLIYDLEDPLNADYFLYGGVSHDVRARTKRQELSTLSFGGEHDFGKIKLDYQLFFAASKEERPDHFEARFDSPGKAITIDFDTTDPDFPRATFPNETNAVNVTNYENYELDEMLLEAGKTDERLLTPRLNLTVPYQSGLGGGYLKLGGKLRARTKERDIRSQTFGAYRETSTLYPGMGGPLNLVTVSDGFRESNLLGKGYVLENMPSAEVMRDFYEFYPQFFIFDRNESRKNSYNQDYTYRENIYAGYAMFRHDFPRLMVLGGLRYERTDVLQNDGFGVILDGNKFVGIDTIKTSRTQDFWLPQLQLKYELTPKINLRAAVTYTYSRPNYVDVIPSREEDRQEVSIGNPDLNFPRSTNVDLMFERYHNRSIFSAGVFYKSIDDFVFSYKRFGREGAPGSGNYPVFEFTKPLNGRDAQVFGTEFQAQFKFDFFNNFLRNFGLFTNYTFIRSQAFIPKRTPANYATAIIINPLADDLSVFFEEEGKEEIPLPGQAQHTANVGFFYDDKKFFARLTANFQDDFLVEIGPDPDLDTYYDQALRLDFTTNVQVSSRLNIFADFINLTNTPLRFYLGTPDVVKQQEFYSWWGRVGVRWRVL